MIQSDERDKSEFSSSYIIRQVIDSLVDSLQVCVIVIII